MPSSRRQLLASLGAGFVGLAGCTAAPDAGSTPSETPTPSTGTPTSTPAPEPATLGDAVAVDGTDVTVEGFTHRHTFLYLSAPDAFGVTVADGQFAFVGVEADGDAVPDPDRFGLDVDGEARHPTQFKDYGPATELDLPAGDGPYRPEDSRGYLAFEVLAPLDAESVAVTLDDVRWAVPASELAPLRSPPPSFTVEYDVPDAVGADEAIPVSLAVANEGDGDGTFRGAINHQGPLYGASDFAVPLAAGTSTTHEETITYHRQEGFSYDRIQFAIVTPAGDRTFEVRLTGSKTGAETETGTETASATSTPSG